MTAAAKELTKKALALTEKERLKLADTLLRSLGPVEAKISRKQRVAETTAVYGNAGQPVGNHDAKVEVSSKKEWNEAWMKELRIRAKEMETGVDPGVALDDVLKFLDEKPRRKP